MGDIYMIVDIVIFLWVCNLVGFYEVGDLVGFSEFWNVKWVFDVFVVWLVVECGFNILVCG